VTVLAAIVLHRLAIPLRRPHAAAHGSEAVRDLIVVEARGADGVVGWGECSTLAEPTYTAEHTAGAWEVLRRDLVPAALAGRHPARADHPMATAGMATALLDLALRRTGPSLAAHLAATAMGGDPPAASVPFCAVVGRRGVADDVVAEVADRLEGRVSAVKLKASPAEDDLVAVEAVRATWPDISLAVDLNGSADDRAISRLARLGLAYVEQPARPDDPATSARWAAELGCPVALDESIGSIADLERAVAQGAGSIVNVKPARCGGPAEAVALGRRAAELGLGAFVGGMVESGVGRAAALAVAAQRFCTLPTDLGPSLAYVDLDVTAPLVVDGDDRILVPDGPGIGRTPDPDRLRAVTTDRVELAP
jgi:O-succinylbenzoate synthase